MERRLNACRQAIAAKGAIDQIIMQGVFLGLPRSGKTSSKKRMVGKRPTPQQASTGVVEKVSRIEIEKTTVFTWNEVTELNEETALVVEDIVDHVTASAKYHIPNERSFDCDSEHQDVQHEVQSSPKDVAGNKSRIRMIVKKVKAMVARKHRNVPLEDIRDTAPSGPSPANQLQVLSTALQIAPTPSRQQQDKKWTVYLSDAGGQPEFQEMLPALVSGPSLYFLTFPLNKGLDERFVVEYQHPDGKLIKPFELTSTTKEVLLQSLASIASTQSYSRVEDGKSVSPKILFIATHQDKVESDKKLLEIDKNLQDTIRKTIAFKENMIVFCSKAQMIFPINNMSDDYDDIQQVKNAVERIGLNSGDYKITTPCTWMIFAITLRHLPERVLSIDQCMEIGKECGIDTQEEMNDALWFLHHNVGIVRHFQTHPELCDVVIKDPQYIFDKVTELIISTFTFENVGPYEQEQFSEKGIFSADALAKMSMDSDILTSDKFAVLLEHLHILAPIELDGNDKYFAPSALTHADLPPQGQMQPIIPPLVVVFECGFCPKGMFGSMVASVLKNDKLSEFDWKLEEESVYRNQICLSIGPYDSFQFSLSSTHVMIALNATTDKARKIPLGRICCDIRCQIEQSIRTVIKVLHYTERAKHAFAFACPEPPPHDQSHAAAINFSPEGEPCNLTCPFNNKRYDLPEGYLLWFVEKQSLLVRDDDGVEEASEYVQSGLPSLFSHPKLHDLALIEGNGKAVRVIQQSAAKWERIATGLHFESYDINRIKKDYNECYNACQTVFVEWLNGSGRKPITWNTLIKVLVEVELSELATAVERVLS